MTYGELTRKLRRLGFQMYRRAKGSHEIWWNPSTRVLTTISAHKDREIPKGTLADILKQLGLTIDELRRN
ncbi:MAG: type II toxin-antitoxin system HicA family toxin [Dehalococcoidia bacterium]|nr:type II toxin-antitoxin system HicA family toxin [Dehalococcoidia bacterium]